METFTVEAIILRTNDFGDANRVVTLFTREFGKLEVNAYGCRRSRSPLSGTLQMFNHISATLTRGTKVDTIREADIINFYDALTADLERLAYASLFFEVVNRMTFPRQQEIETFELLKKSLPVLSIRNPKIASLIGISQFLVMSGEFPNLKDAAQDCQPYPEALRRTFETMLNFDWREDTKLSFNSRQLHVAEKFFLNCVHVLIGDVLKSEQFIREFLQ